MSPALNWFFDKPSKWQKECNVLRAIVLDCALKEELKWGQPCYTSQGRNIVIIHGFKNYCALLFIKGVLLKDPEKILIQQTENVQTGRQVRFTNVKEIEKLAPVLKAYIREAEEIEKKGLKIALKKTEDYPVPEEFQNRLDENPLLKKAFNALTPGRQRQYIFYFSQAKQSKTRTERVEKCTKQILLGKGMND